MRTGFSYLLFHALGHTCLLSPVSMNFKQFHRHFSRISLNLGEDRSESKKNAFLWEKNISAAPCFTHTYISCTNNTNYNAIISRAVTNVQKQARLSKKWTVAWLWRLPWGVQKGLTFLPLSTAGPMKIGHPEMTAHFWAHWLWLLHTLLSHAMHFASGKNIFAWAEFIGFVFIQGNKE